ncbi:MAG: AAA family ATPase [Armatimonadetes bacterium]|nr:AAA family ATPase [Armatimonadota bacterium]
MCRWEADDPEPLRIPAPDPLSALEVAAGFGEPALFVLKDFHHHLESPAVLRRLRDLAAALPATGKHLIFLGPRFRTPEDLEKEVVVLDLPPPGVDELGALLEQVLALQPSSRLSPHDQEALLRSALGLTLGEVESILARAVVRDGAITARAVELVLAEKRQIVRRHGLVEFLESRDGLEQVGGLATLKAWLQRREAAFSEAARAFGLPVPKGMLLLGVQGCGKSLVARAVSRAWAMPLLRLDLGRVFGKFIGESEAAIRRAIQTAEAVSPCILWLDELEKGFAGAAGDAHDAGVSARVLGTFLTWMQEKEKPVFVVATANQIRSLPPELLRKGRFDELFFIDLPEPAEREAILAVHLRKRGRDPSQFDCRELAARTDGFTGAELEQVVLEALSVAFAERARAVTQRDLLRAAEEIIPISVTMKESITAMRNWATVRTRKAA